MVIQFLPRLAIQVATLSKLFFVREGIGEAEPNTFAFNPQSDVSVARKLRVLGPCACCRGVWKITV